MVSTPGDRIQPSNTARTDDQSVHSQPLNQRAMPMDTEQTFRLIDSILPFEACLYHQVLPLSLEGSRLRLGMVNLDDAAAMDYVRRILAYMNCSLVPQVIVSDTHHAVLSAYLNYTGQKKQAQAAANQAKQPAQISSPITAKATVQSEAAKASDSSSSAKLDRNAQPTLIVDSPEALSFFELDLEQSQAKHPSALPDLAANDVPLQADPNQTAILEDLHPLAPPAMPVPSAVPELVRQSQGQPAVTPLPGDALPILDIDPTHLHQPVETLVGLPPKKLLHELLARVLVDGIGRLYFERQQQHGRILWSQNGVLQSVLDQLSPTVFQGVINELKLLTHLPLLATNRPKQVEIERLYQQNRLLLRLRVMPGTHGEEATLQVLRGAALKFYQQQQLSNLSRDALGIAQQLQNKVNEIRHRTRFNPMLSIEHLELLPALNEVLKSVDEQLEALKALQDHERFEDQL